jgi:hypothetical protein
VRIRGPNGEPLGFGTALHREGMVWLRGLGLGIPIVTLFTNWSAYKTLTETGSTSWDKDLHAEASYRPSGTKQIVGAVIGVLVWMLALGCLAALSSG